MENVKTLNEPGTFKILDIDFPAVQLTKQGEKILATRENVEAIINAYGITLSMNLLTKSLEIYNPHERPGLRHDEDTLLVFMKDCLRHYKISMSTADLTITLVVIAKLRRYNPAHEYYKQSYDQWLLKGKPDILKTLIDTLKFDDTKITVEQVALLVSKWLLSCVALPVANDLDFIAEKRERARSQGKPPLTYVVAEGILTLQSEKQGVGKTTWFKQLFANVPDFFKEGQALDPTNKDSYIPALKNIALELGEADFTMKKDQSVLKAFITRSEDGFRVPYGKNYENHPRTTVFCATVNPMDFLKDSTGNRRWWVIPLLDIDRTLYNTIDMNLLWGQIYSKFLQVEREGSLYKLNAPWHLTEDEREVLEHDNLANFTINSPFEDFILELYDFQQDPILTPFALVKSEMTKALYEKMGMRIDLMSSKNNTALGTALRKLNIEKVRPRIDGVKTMCYNMPPLKEKYRTTYYME